MTRISSAWDYQREGECESWNILAHVDGTEGNLNKVVCARLVIEEGREEMFPHDGLVWVGPHAEEEARKWAFGE